MQAEQIDLVRSTFARVALRAPAVGQAFYTQLFAQRPALRGLFPAAIDAQGHKLMQVLATAVAGLDSLPDLLPALHELGLKHAGYGVTPDHYEWVGQALIGTLEAELRTDFTPAARAAWLQAYAALAGAMRMGAQHDD